MMSEETSSITRGDKNQEMSLNSSQTGDVSLGEDR